MSQTRRFACLAGLMAALLAGTAVEAAERTLRFSHTDTAVGSRQKAAELFAAKVAEYSGGTLKVDVFHSGQLANDPKAIEQLTLGGIDFTVSGTGSYATYEKLLNLTALPFLVDGYDQGWKWYDTSTWLQAQFDKLPAKGIRMLATWEAGFRSFTTTMPLATPADAKGRKMRVFPNDMVRWIMESIGFNPVVMPVTEVYLAIQQGTVIGQENPVDTIYSQRFYEVAPYITLTQHIYSPIPLAVSEITWQSLSAEEQAAVGKAATESAAYIRDEVKAQQAAQLEEMQGKGAKVSIPELGPFKTAVEPVYAKAREVYGAEVDTVLAEAEAIRKAMPAAAN
jgi:tripartite ATP-independent transporter DctP family solute receptor